MWCIYANSHNICLLQQTDSAAFYTDKAIPYLKDYKNVVGENIHPDFFQT